MDIFKINESRKEEITETQDNQTELEIKGRHDVCLCPRIVPVVEAMTAITLADFLLLNKTSK